MYRFFQTLPLVFLTTMSLLFSQTKEESAAADRMDALAVQLQDAQTAKQRGKPAKVSFQIPEAEANAFIRYGFTEAPRPGVESVRVKFFPKNYVSSYMVVDLDKVNEWRPGTVPTMLQAVLKGKQGIQVDARFRTVNGGLLFDIEKASVNDVRVPAFVVQQILKVVAARQPQPYDLSKPVPLPNGVQRMWTGDKILYGEN